MIATASTTFIWPCEFRPPSPALRLPTPSIERLLNDASLGNQPRRSRGPAAPAKVLVQPDRTVALVMLTRMSLLVVGLIAATRPPVRLPSRKSDRFTCEYPKSDHEGLVVYRAKILSLDVSV